MTLFQLGINGLVHRPLKEMLSGFHNITGKHFNGGFFSMAVIVEAIDDSVILIRVDEVQSNSIVTGLDRAKNFR
jgi:hypothetical protein